MRAPEIGDVYIYHFCAGVMLGGILREGLTKGRCPMVTKDKVGYVSGCQWLTAEGDRQKQSWATQIDIKYDRTEYRLKVKIPFKARHRLIRAADYIKRFPIEMRHVVLDWKGHEDWYVFEGKIPADWIVQVEKVA